LVESFKSLLLQGARDADETRR